MRMMLGLLLCALAGGAERRLIFPPGAKPIGPYSPGVIAGGYLYVAGQGALDSSGRFPDGLEARTRQCLENVKTVVEAAGLTLEHIVYTQVYLTDMGNHETVEKVLAAYFPHHPPARATLGVARMPRDTPVEINAVAVLDLKQKKVLPSGAVMTNDRLFLPGILGRDVDQTLDAATRVMKEAGLDLAHLVFVNPYLTGQIPTEVMNRAYARRFEFGYTPARATIHVASLPGGAPFELTGVAVRDLRQRRVVRPKNMPPSPTASPCVWAGDTLYCSAKAGFIPGPGSGIWPLEVEHQVRQTMRNLLDGLEEAGLDFSHVVATNVYLDSIDEFAKMNAVYGSYFGAAAPARTTVQQSPSIERKRDDRGRAPALEQISLIAVR